MTDRTGADLDRRRLLCGLAGCGCAVLIASCTIAEVYTEAGSATLPFDLATPPFDALAMVGGTLGVDVETSGDPAKVLLIRASEEAIVALERICPHTLCDMNPANGLGVWDQGEQQLICVCHQSVFARDGRKLSGPSPRGLAEYTVAFDAAAGTAVLTIGEGAPDAGMGDGAV